VSWNTYLRKYLAVSSALLSPRINLYVADAPEGPWSQAIATIQTEPSIGPWDWTESAVGHPEFAGGGGETEYVTYRRNVEHGNEIRLMELRLRRK
jgi:hypothetical protein